MNGYQFWGAHWTIMAVAAPIIIFGIWAFITELKDWRDERDQEAGGADPRD